MIKPVFNAFLAAANLSPLVRVVDLVGSAWTLSNPSLNISVPAQLPSHAHLDLFANQVIGDPLFGLNNFNLRWVAWSNWTYTSDPVQDLSTDRDRTWLLFNGLDTFASIFFCGQFISSTNNQFRQYFFDISTILKSCPPWDRVVAVNFGSAPIIADQLALESKQTWPTGVQQVYQFPNRWFIRKEQSDFGWDWGPAFAPAGPWQPASLIQFNEGNIYVRNSIVDVFRMGQINLIPPDQNQPWMVNASLDVLGIPPADISMRYRLTEWDNITTISCGHLEALNVSNNAITGMTTVSSESVKLWWPVGMGNQTLYHLTIEVVSSKNATLATVTKRIGFRTIVLNELPISKAQLAQGIAPGNNWHFEINGHEFYAKGSNFIPPDVFWPRVTRAKIQQLFDSVVAGNQNTPRIWSSGAYSPDFLYDLADELGIPLWSEFEFGDALYPVDPEFLDNVREEAEYQVRRINHHPSLALWAGGNELENLELILVNNSAPDQLPKYMAEYEKLFLDTLSPVIFRNTRSIGYTPSSTSNGWLSLNFSNPNPIAERYFNRTPGSIYGETDFYNYDPSALYNDDAYPVGRFSNEFGFHSMPSIQSWRQQISENDLHFNSTVVMLRNQHPPPGSLNSSDTVTSSIDQGQMTRAVQAWFPTPNKTNSAANFSAWCHATQLYQAELYVSEIQFYRRGSGLPNRQLGSLYWQLEDIWVAPTWASIEYDGRWKVVHYAVKHIYEPIIIAPHYNRTSGELSVWVTSDLWEPVTGIAYFTWYDWTGKRYKPAPASKTFNVGAINSTRVLRTSDPNFPTSDLDNLVLRMEIEAQGRSPNSETTRTFRHDNWFHPASLSKARLVDPGLQLQYCSTTKNFTVTATSGVAAFVWLDYPAGVVVHFDSNAFWLAPHQSREISYTMQGDITNGRWIQDVTVQSLWNMTLAD